MQHVYKDLIYYFYKFWDILVIDLLFNLCFGDVPFTVTWYLYLYLWFMLWNDDMHFGGLCCSFSLSKFEMQWLNVIRWKQLLFIIGYCVSTPLIVVSGLHAKYFFCGRILAW